ncbi:uncharacterized protein LOC116343071 [Contarinia nasturtii]|uniref:uncharacterized protein LOC116343071 n=1 Tax=Contarinia nasturtii TaxID=265458 RepID=UPI0012D40DD6|nr:uncharacterized protein LOC116343071 [Contarinia nasturtii]
MKMKKLCAVLFFSIFFLSVSGAFLSDGIEEFRFTKAPDDSDEYDFEYDRDGGYTFRGRTFILNDLNDHIYIMFGADDVLYWVKFTDDEYKYKQCLMKTVRLIERTENKLMFRDDFIQYDLTISKGFMFVSPYQTQWNFEKICFSKSAHGNQTFNYVLLATNNSRQYNGTTDYTTNDPVDPHVQLIHVEDGVQTNGVYEVNFTDSELSTNNMFCKGISKKISETGVLGAYPVSNINPDLIKSLVG